MAANTRSRGRTAPADETNTEVTEPEAPVTETNENTDAPAEASAPVTTAAPKPDKSAELATFKTTLTSVVEGADAETGVPTDEAVTSVVDAYQALTGDRKAQNAAKAAIVEGLSKAVETNSMTGARGYLAIQRAIDEAKPASGSAPKEPADPTEAFVARYATLNLGLTILINTVPEGVDDAWQTKLEDFEDSVKAQLLPYFQWATNTGDDRGEEPEAHATVKAAVALAMGKGLKGVRAPRTTSATPFEGERGDIKAHIVQAFAGVPVGESLTVAQIVGFASEGAGYDGRKPSQGAVSSRLNSKAWNVEATGIKANEGSKPFSATKVNVPSA